MNNNSTHSSPTPDSEPPVSSQEVDQQHSGDDLTLLAGEAQSSESSAAIRACNDYLRMGPGRSVRGLGAQYRKTAQNLAPTQSYPTLRAWSEKFEWKKRAKQFDISEDQLHSAMRAQVLKEGLALNFKRVDALNRIGSGSLVMLIANG